jgi:3-hydroxyisobutyrate dehydrogenase
MTIAEWTGCMKVGLIGVGELGKAIAGNMLKAGHTLLVYDTRREQAESILARGAVWGESVWNVATAVDVLLTALPNPTIVEAVMTGEEGALAGLKPGSCWIDHSTNDGELLKRLAAEAAKKGVDVIEAPVTGGIPLAYAGEITVLVGGEKDVVEVKRPLLEIVGNPVIHLGPVGSASIVKVMTNMLAFIHLWALGEGLMLCKEAGLDVSATFEAIKASCGNSFVAETEGPPILNGSYDYGFTLELAAKDMRLVQQIARQHNVPLEMGGLADQILTRALRRYGGKFWSTGVVKMLEDDLHSDLRAAGYEPEERW